MNALWNTKLLQLWSIEGCNLLGIGKDSIFGRTLTAYNSIVNGLILLVLFVTFGLSSLTLIYQSQNFIKTHDQKISNFLICTELRYMAYQIFVYINI